MTHEEKMRLPPEARLRLLGISLEPATPEQLERTRRAVEAIKAWADRVGPLGVSAEELLKSEWDEDEDVNG